MAKILFFISVTLTTIILITIVVINGSFSENWSLFLMLAICMGLSILMRFEWEKKKNKKNE